MPLTRAVIASYLFDRCAAVLWCDVTVQVVETARGKALADEYSIQFFETSAKANTNVTECFVALAQEILKTWPQTGGAGGSGLPKETKAGGGGCCGSS